MSVSTKTVALAALKEMLVDLPLEALAMLLEWISGASKEPDPMRYILRKAQADAAKGASTVAVNAVLEATAKARRKTKAPKP